MPATTNYQAGYESNQVALAYLQETAWGVGPTGQFKEIPYTAETFRGTKTRSRPPERNAKRVQSPAVTTERNATAGFSFGLRYGAYDDLLAGVLGGDWVGNVLTNGLLFKSFFFEKRFAANNLLQYPGTFLSGASLTIQRGQFLGGSFTGESKNQVVAIASQSTGGTYLEAPDARVMDPVGGIRDLMLDGAPMLAKANSITLNLTNEGAAADFALGDAAAAGMRQGTFGLGGTAEFYFREQAMMQRYEAETQGEFSLRTLDAAGNAYRIRLPGLVLMNPTVQSGGVNQPVMATYELEANAVNGVVIEITRIPVATGP